MCSDGALRGAARLIACYLPGVEPHDRKADPYPVREILAHENRKPDMIFGILPDHGQAAADAG